MSCCPHCQRPFAPEIKVGGYVRQNIYEFVKKNPQGVSRQQIEDAIYATHRDGGPENADKSIYVMIHKINKTLQAHGMRIQAHRGAGAVYQLQNTNELEPTVLHQDLRTVKERRLAKNRWAYQS